MGLAPFLKSALKTAADELPDTIKTQSAVPLLKKAGVKDEELTFSGVGAKLEKAKELGMDRVSRDAIETAIPEGQFGNYVLDNSNSLYQWVSINEGAHNPTYRERIITFGEPGRYTSGHFPADGNKHPDNYLMHNRVFDTYVDGIRTRVLQEVQSDLHQQGRQVGYGSATVSDAAMDDIEGQLLMLNATPDSTLVRENLLIVAKRHGYEGSEDAAEVEAWARAQRGESKAVPKSPWEKTWLKKGIEIEIAAAVDDGLGQLMIPIKGGSTDKLHRAEGVQQWYETTVVNTAKKVAKQYGAKVRFTTATNDKELDDFAASMVPKIFEDRTRLERTKAGLIRIAATKGISAEDMEKFMASITEKPDSSSRLAEQLLGPDFDIIDDYNLVSAIGDYVLESRPGRADDRLATQLKILSDGSKLSIDELKAILDSASDTSADSAAEVIERIQRTMNVTYDGNMIIEFPKEQIGINDNVAFDAAFAYLNAKDPATKAALADDAYSAAAELNMSFAEYVRTAAGKHQPMKPKKPDFKLYTAPGAGVLALYATAKQEGYSDDEMMQYADSKGMGEEMKFVMAAKTEGYDDAEISAFLNGPVEPKGQETEFVAPANDPEEIQAALEGSGPEKTQAYARLVTDGTHDDFGTLLADMKVVQPNMTSVSLRTAAFFGGEEASRKAAEASRMQAQKIVNLAKDKFGLNLEWNEQQGQFYAELPHGKIEVTDGILDTLFAEGGELTGALIGGGAGAFLGRNLGGWGMLLASMGGAVGGAVLGTEADYLRQSIKLQTEMHAEVAAHKALTAAEASVIGDVVGAGLLKGFGGSWKLLDNTIQAIRDGNSKGALQAIKEVFFVSDSEAAEMVTRLGRVLVEPLTGNVRQQQIKAIATTKQGGDILIKAASQIDPLAGQAAIKAVDARAKDLLATSASLTDENIGRVIKEDLVNYTHEVKDFYQRVKNQAAASPYGNNFRFNFERLALNPALEAVKKNLMSRGDTHTLERFALQAQRINSMSDSRSFTDLIELRQLVNDFLFNKKITNAKDSKLLMEVRDNIDSAIDLGAKVVLRENADTWKANFEAAKLEYAKMKGLERNVLNRLLNRKGVSEEVVVKGLTKYITAIDGTFSEVVAKLPQSTRFKTEGAIINSLTEKFTDGTGDSLRAVHFPLLDAELKKIAFTSPEARQYKAMVGEFAEIFKNDVPIANMTGQIQIPKFQSYLTADPVVRAKFEIASTVFNTVKTFVPGQTQRNMAAVKNVAKLLETPLNSKAARDVMASFADDVNIEPAIVRMQQEAARQAMAARDQEAVLVKLYGESTVKALKGKAEALKVPMHRIASQADAKLVADQDGILMSDTASLDFALKQRGYAGLMHGADKVRVLK